MKSEHIMKDVVMQDGKSNVIIKWGLKAAFWAATFSVGVFTSHAVIEAMSHFMPWYINYQQNLFAFLEPAIEKAGEVIIAGASVIGQEDLFLTQPAFES
jgi:hypothetical protein